MVWENHSFPKDYEVMNLSAEGDMGQRDIEYEEKMKSMKSVINLYKINGKDIILEKQVKLKGNAHPDSYIFRNPEGTLQVFIKR